VKGTLSPHFLPNQRLQCLGSRRFGLATFARWLRQPVTPSVNCLTGSNDSASVSTWNAGSTPPDATSTTAIVVVVVRDDARQARRHGSVFRRGGSTAGSWTTEGSDWRRQDRCVRQTRDTGTQYLRDVLQRFVAVLDSNVCSSSEVHLSAV